MLIISGFTTVIEDTFYDKPILGLMEFPILV